MNVSNVKALATKLRQQNIKVDYQEHAWGTIAKFFDPDGNLLAFKDSKKFEVTNLIHYFLAFVGVFYHKTSA